MLSKAEKEYLQVRKAKGKLLENGKIVLSEKYYSKGYQKVLNHRILKKMEKMDEELDMVREHSDLDAALWKIHIRPIAQGRKNDREKREEKRHERNASARKRNKRKKQLIWELEQINLEEDKFFEESGDLGEKKKKKPIVRLKDNH